jgi:cytochrome c oxidase cbb3-type subunit 3
VVTKKSLKIGSVLGFGVLAALFLIRAPMVSGKLETALITPAAGLPSEELFKANCARCHGNNGEGGKGPNLTTEKKKAKWKDSDQKLVDKITKGGFIMPSFRKKLNAGEIKSIAAYVRTLPPQS